MSGPEQTHRQKAETLLNELATCELGSKREQSTLAEALVHAILALDDQLAMLPGAMP
jgi:hypothetical protein